MHRQPLRLTFSRGDNTLALPAPDHAAPWAVFSPDERHRYALGRRVADAHGRDMLAAFIGLNPSTADETKNDPTVTRCQHYAAAWGCSLFIMLNLFAIRSTDPAELYRVADPVGPENDRAILHYAAQADVLVAAWGNHGAHHGRAADVLAMLNREYGLRPLAFKLTKAGQPQHPLYLPAALRPSDLLL